MIPVYSPVSAAMGPYPPSCLLSSSLPPFLPSLVLPFVSSCPPYSLRSSPGSHKAYLHPVSWFMLLGVYTGLFVLGPAGFICYFACFLHFVSRRSYDLSIPLSGQPWVHIHLHVGQDPSPPLPSSFPTPRTSHFPLFPHVRHCCVLQLDSNVRLHNMIIQ